MAISEDDIEYSRLEGQVQAMEKVLASARDDIGIYLRAFLAGAKDRMEILKGGQTESLEHERKEKDKLLETATIASLVERETKLDDEEKREYAGFLKCEYFTKANFVGLDGFYSHTWDRLSDEGKSQMSQRVWGGIRHGEYSFEELPTCVRKKEADQIYLQLIGQEKADPGLAQVPLQDRQDFILAHESKDEAAASKVLGREGFSSHIYEKKSDSLSESELDKVDKLLPDSLKAKGSKKESSVASEIDNAGMAGLADSTPVAMTQLPKVKSEASIDR